MKPSCMFASRDLQKMNERNEIVVSEPIRVASVPTNAHNSFPAFITRLKVSIRIFHLIVLPQSV